MVTQAVFLALVACVALQRLAELRISKRHEASLRARGGREHGREQMVWMTLLHGAWLAAMPLEVWVLERPFEPWLAALALLVFLCGQALRYAAMRALGERWCVKVMTVPGESVRRTGIFAWLRHPNYLGVVLEIAALPLVHGAWLTALSASVLNGLLLVWRIRVEERALSADEDYAEAFALRAAGASRR